MDPYEIAMVQSQRGQATALPGREVQVQVRGLGAATGPVVPTPPPPPSLPGASAAGAGLLGVPWWAWALLGIGVYAAYSRRAR